MKNWATEHEIGVPGERVDSSGHPQKENIFSILVDLNTPKQKLVLSRMKIGDNIGNVGEMYPSYTMLTRNRKWYWSLYN